MSEEIKTTVQTTESTRTMHTQPESRPAMLSSVLAIIGVIIIFIIIVWGLFHIATLSQPWFSSLFTKTTTPTTIAVTAPAQVTSGEVFTVSWKYVTSAQGTYALLYQCKDTLRFETTNASGMTNTIPCGAAFTVNAPQNEIRVRPILSGATSTPVLFSILFMPNTAGTPQARGDATVTVNPQKAAVKTPAKPVVVAKPRPSGPTDLSVRIISLTVDGSGNGVATFDIANIGSSPTGVYYFTAQLPTADGYLYSSPAQSSLASGDHVMNTLRFSSAVSGLFSVVVDPAHAIRESNTQNNYASQSVYIPNYAPQYPQPYQYPYGF